MARRIDVFYAYPARPESLGEVIEAAIRETEVRRDPRSGDVRFRPWSDMSISGRRLLGQITERIDRCDVFACDLTYVNSNVAFELGYAVGKFKRVWLGLDGTIAAATSNFKRLYTGMLGIGYASYENHHTLASALLRDRPWSTPNEHLLHDAYRRQAARPENPTLLYVKPPLQPESVVEVGELLSGSIFADGLVVDDPREDAAPPLEWYVDKIHTADAVLLHLLAENQRGQEEHNAKASFLAGLAHALRKDLLMLAQTPFACPTDYSTKMRTHDTAAQAAGAVRLWFDSLHLQARRPRRAGDASRRSARGLQLRNLSIGEPVAENENLQLDDYFVETSTFYDAQEASSTVVVGRRGTGKTALFIALESAFRRDKRNHVCTVKPVGYEIDGLIRLLSEDWKAAERGFLVESLWKFLLYTELAASVVREMDDRPAYQVKSQDETQLAEYVQRNAEILLAPFSQRVARAITSLKGAGALGESEAQRARISEMLHREHLGVLRQLLGLVLGRRAKVVILIDNLDEPWHAGQDAKTLSRLLLGLLDEIKQLSEDFHHGDFHQRAINLSVTTFLRSDIFAYIHPLANERDKWPLRRINWNDSELLLRVVDERLKHAAPSSFDAAEIWKQVFPGEVVGLTAREFVLRNTLPRPRDVIYLVKEAMAQAVNRGHSAVMPEDLLSAREQYSRYVFGSILAEDDPDRGRLEAVLFEFAGAGRVLSRLEIEERMGRAGVTREDCDFYVGLLCDVNFVAIQTQTGFRFAVNEEDRQMMVAVARRIAARQGLPAESYEINPAFYQALQIE